MEPMTVSLLTNGRRQGAFGLAGGSSGAPGINRLIRLDGTVEALGHLAQFNVLSGDQIRIETPGRRVRYRRRLGNRCQIIWMEQP